MINKKLIEEVIEELGVYTSTNALVNAVSKLKEAITPKPRFYYNQPVLVSDGLNAPHVAAFFRGYDDGRFVTVETLGGAELSWDNCIPYPEAVSIPNWLPYDKTKTVFTNSNKKERVIYSQDKTMYCIIPEPKYLEVSDENTD